MLRLTVMSGPQDGQEIAVSGPSALIGSEARSDLCLLHDRALPPAGVKILVRDGSVIVDDGSTVSSLAAGTLVHLGRTLVRVAVD